VTNLLRIDVPYGRAIESALEFRQQMRRPATEQICVTAYGDYRRGVVTAIRLLSNDTVQLVGGTEAFDPTVKLLEPGAKTFSPIRNVFLFGRRALIQRGATWSCVRATNLVLDLNPRVINVWGLLVIRRLLRRKTTLWGHAWSRSGKKERWFSARSLQKRLASAVVVYTETQRREMLELYPSLPVYAAPNALYSSQLILKPRVTQPNDRNDILCVGRLVDDKKPLLLLEAFLLAARSLPSSTRLIFVGDGPLSARLHSGAAARDMAHRILLPGHISDIGKLEVLYSTAFVSVSPGYVGLSITQSLAFGVPMAIAEDEPHAPEIEAAEPGENCRFFKSNSVEALAVTLLDFFRERDMWASRADSIRTSCATRYSTESMARGILAGLRHA
jgi:glycosyltransferase involved in cell wall biosynthesis